MKMTKTSQGSNTRHQQEVSDRQVTQGHCNLVAAHSNDLSIVVLSGLLSSGSTIVRKHMQKLEQFWGAGLIDQVPLTHTASIVGLYMLSRRLNVQQYYCLMKTFMYI